MSLGSCRILDQFLGLQSGGGNTSLIGATGQAKQIIAWVGNNLRIETLQDTSHYESKQQSASVSGTLCYGYCSSSISGNVSQGQMKSDFKSASEQAGLKAGDGGFIVDVKHNTTLIGGVIASSDKAVADGLNTLSTGTLVTEDLKNSASYKASQVGISGGWSGSGSLGTDRDGNVAGGSRAEPGTAVPQTKSGVGMGTPVVAAASGNSSSTTQSGISGGKIAIRDEAGQLALTGKTAAETIASLNRDTTDTLNALKPIFDKEKIEAGFEIASEAQRQTGQFLTNRAKEIDRLVERSKDIKLSDDERKEAAEAAKKLNAEWGASGSYRRILTAVSAGAAGNVTGTTASFAQSAAVNYLQGLAASRVKKIADSLGSGLDADAARAALHGIVGCAGAAASGGSCSAGALGAGASSVIARLLAEAAGDNLTATEREQRSNLIASLVGGVSESLGMDTPTSVAAAVTELTNNALTLSELKQFGVEAASCELLGTCDEVRKKFQDLSIKNQETMVAVCASDPSACQQLYGHYVTQVSEYRAELDKLAGMDLPAGLKTDLAIYLLQNSDAVNIALNTEFAAQIQEKWGIDSETAAQLVAIAAGAVGAIKSGKGPGSTSALPPNFNGSLVAHNTQVGVLNKRGQISGAHNNDSFLETVEITGAKISNKITGERFPGLVEYTYQMPKLNPRGEPSGGYKLPQTKTTYDSSVLSDSKVADMSSRAAAYAQTEFNSAPGVRETNIKIDRYYFHVTKDANTGEVNNSFITMPSRVKNE